MSFPPQHPGPGPFAGGTPGAGHAAPSPTMPMSGPPLRAAPGPVYTPSPGSVTPPPAPGTGAGSVELAALLGRGTRYIGKLYFEGRVRIEGHFKGEIRGQDVLIVGEGAEVEADIEVGACIVTGGRVVGNIRARDAIELHVPAVVLGDLHAPAVFIDRGVSFEGRCHMAPLEAAGEPADDEPRRSPLPDVLRRAHPAHPPDTLPGLPPPVEDT